jgi:putative ABC transport system permease protein
VTANGGRVIVLSDAYWRTRFGSAPDAVGRTIFLNDQPFRIVGVMPARFSFPYGRPTFWTPLDPAASESGNTRVNAVGRLRSGLAVAAAQTVLDGVKAPGPTLIEGGGLKLVPLDQHRVNPRPRKALLALLGAVGFVLLLACVNAANLLLVRASDRQGEIAIRLAMGAARGRIVRELLTEALVLAIAGGGLGVILAWIGIDGLAKLVASALTFLTVARIEMDPRVLLFTVGITVLTSIVFGLVPSLLASRFDLASALGLSAVRTTSDRGARRLRSGLVVVEVGLAMVLLVGASLMIRSFVKLSTEPLGFDPQNLVAADLSLPKHRYTSPEAQRQFFDSLKERVASIPGVSGVAIAAGIPPSGGGMQFDLEIEVEGRAVKPKDLELILPFSRVDTDYFRTMKIPMVRGRGFVVEDGDEGQSNVIVNAAMARSYWPNEDPVGSRIRLSKTGKWMTVVGVAGDVKIGAAGSGFSDMAVYYPFNRTGGRGGQYTIVARTTADPSPTVVALRTLVRALDKDQPILRLDTVESRFSESLAEPRFYARLLTCFAALSVLLMAIGIYGVMAHSVAQRTREIGIRVALGALRKDVMSLVLARGLLLAGAGIASGIMAATWLSRAMASFLFGASASDAPSLTIASLIMIATALAACWIPASRAARVEPIVALRQE